MAENESRQYEIVLRLPVTFTVPGAESRAKLREDVFGNPGNASYPDADLEAWVTALDAAGRRLLALMMADQVLFSRFLVASAREECSLSDALEAESVEDVLKAAVELLPVDSDDRRVLLGVAAEEGVFLTEHAAMVIDALTFSAPEIAVLPR